MLADPCRRKSIRLAGFEPATYGLGIRVCDVASPDSNKDLRQTKVEACRSACRDPRQPATDQTACTNPTPPQAPDPDLACVLAAWPSLPAPIRSAILALINAAETGLRSEP